MTCPLCNGELEAVFSYDAPPEGETPFDIPAQDYRREFRRCRLCGHWVAAHDIDLDALYAGTYVDATYSGDGLSRAYERIMSLPPERSDNVRRVRRIVDWFDSERPGAERRALDVGSGLAVFPARMREAGWSCTALDPDERAVEHARERAGVEAVQADFMQAGPELGRYELVTFNKVLEHVQDPVAMLARTREFLADGGTVYAEVPDGELAWQDGPGREEFFIEHYYAFSLSSLSLLADRAGFVTRTAGRVREPSDKYTLYAFME